MDQWFGCRGEFGCNVATYRWHQKRRCYSMFSFKMRGNETTDASIVMLHSGRTPPPSVKKNFNVFSFLKLEPS